MRPRGRPPPAALSGPTCPAAVRLPVRPAREGLLDNVNAMHARLGTPLSSSELSPSHVGAGFPYGQLGKRLLDDVNAMHARLGYPPLSAS